MAIPTIEGVLKRFEYKDDVVYYLDCSIGDIRFHNNFNTDVLDEYIDTKRTCSYMLWNYLTEGADRYRIIDINL